MVPPIQKALTVATSPKAARRRRVASRTAPMVLKRCASSGLFSATTSGFWPLPHQRALITQHQLPGYGGGPAAQARVDKPHLESIAANAPAFRLPKVGREISVQLPHLILEHVHPAPGLLAVCAVSGAPVPLAEPLHLKVPRDEPFQRPLASGRRSGGSAAAGLAELQPHGLEVFLHPALPLLQLRLALLQVFNSLGDPHQFVVKGLANHPSEHLLEALWRGAGGRGAS
mmetsp:Transcript_71982/g.204257  ORF Transcript_71982/g.204257 Transcript_71982/m.204257 type:complete len:229 (-) Transcript_71982:292-978(-)